MKKTAIHRPLRRLVCIAFAVLVLVSLLAITGMQPYIKAACLALVALLTLFGIGSLAAKQRCVFLQQHQERLSLALQGGEVLLFILCRQTYAAAFAFMFLAIKALMLLRQR